MTDTQQVRPIEELGREAEELNALEAAQVQGGRLNFPKIEVSEIVVTKPTDIPSSSLY